MNTFKVKAFKQTSKFFEVWIEDPHGMVKHIKLRLAEYGFPSKSTYLCTALNLAIESHLQHLEDVYYTQAAITADALGSIHQNSFIAKDFEIPRKES